MSMTAAAICFYTDSERLAYQKIDGMNEVLRATPSELEDISTKYPDAMFAIMIHEEMVYSPSVPLFILLLDYSSVSQIPVHFQAPIK